MASFDQNHAGFPSEPSTADPLARALHDVAIPEDLEQKILATLKSHGADVATTNRRLPAVLTRRGWMAAAIAASCSGVMIAGGGYFWSRRPLHAKEIEQAIQECLAERNWIRPWNRLPDHGDVEGIPFPRELRRSEGWQYQATRLAKVTVAYDVSIPGCPAVLFACKTWRNISAFDSPLPAAPTAQTGIWKNVAIWQRSGRFLYVLALQGTERDYRLLTEKGAAAFA